MPGRFLNGALAAHEQKILRAIFFVDRVFVRQIVADRGYAEIASFNQRLDRFHHRQFERLALVFRVPRSLLFKISGAFRQLFHGGGNSIVSDRHKTLRTSFGAARVAINLDKAVIEVDGRVVLYPRGAKRKPLGIIAGLVVADQMGNRRGLRRLGVGARLLEAGVRFTQKCCIEPGRDAAVRSAGAVDKFRELAVGAFYHPRVQRIFRLKPLQIRLT